VKLENFTTDWSDGKAIWRLAEAFGADLSNFRPQNDLQRITIAMAEIGMSCVLSFFLSRCGCFASLR
jgi:hypothetical protein